MRKILVTLAVLTIAISPIAGLAQSIVYDINRTVGAGTITGFVQTNGTLGVLSSGDITDWSLTLDAPNLLGGPTDTINFGSGSITFLSGSATTATLSQLLFDFNSTTGIFLLQGANSNFWCLQIAGCTNLPGAGERIGQGTSGQQVAQFAAYSGSMVVGTVNVAPVPEPEIYAMMGLGLGLLGWIGRRKRLQQSATEG